MTFTPIAISENCILSELNNSTNNIGGITNIIDILKDTDTKITVKSTSTFPKSGTIKIDLEYIIYDEILDNTFINCIRGAFNSVATVHNANSNIYGCFVGISEYSKLPDVLVSCKSSQPGIEYFDFSNDNLTWDSFPINGFDVYENKHEIHIAVKSVRYFRIRYITTSEKQTTEFRIYTYFGTYKQGNTPLYVPITKNTDSILTRSILTGKTEGGLYLNVPLTTQGHIQVALSEPKLPFGSIHTEKMTPIIQLDGVYGFNPSNTNISTYLSGTVNSDNSMMVTSTGITKYASSTLQSYNRIRYRPGQGIIAVFTALFDNNSNPPNNCYAIIGIGHAEDGVYFGYRNINNSSTEFGILYTVRGKRQVVTLTLTTAANKAGNVVITLNGTAFSIPVTASGNIQRTVWELSMGVYTGWSAQTISSNSVIFISDSAGLKSGTYILSAGTSGSTIGTFSITRIGAPTNEIFIPQSKWNGDVLNGTSSTSNPSGILADWSKGNVFKIGIQYLGFGTIEFSIEGNLTWINVHTMNLPNTLSDTSFRNPSFPITQSVYSAGSTTNISIKSGSFAGFIEGDIRYISNRFTYYRTLLNLTNGIYYALFTIQNKIYYGSSDMQSLPNQNTITLISCAISANDNGNTELVSLALIKNGKLIGNPSFSSYATNSISLYDESATSVTFNTNDQLLFTLNCTAKGNQIFAFVDPIVLQPGDYVTVAAISNNSTISIITGSLNTREDQ